MINSRILYNGFYISPENHWTDWHAGNKFEGNNYDIYLFLNEYDVVSMSVESLNFSFEVFNSRKNYIDNYRIIDKNTLEIIFNPNDEYPVKKNFTILSSNILLDKDLREYHFKYTVGIEFEKIELMKAINRGDNIWVTSNPLDMSLIYKGESATLKSFEEIIKFLKISNIEIDKITDFGKEVLILSNNGYTYNTSAKMFTPASASVSLVPTK